MVADKIKPDPLVMKCVAFDVDNEYPGSNISNNFGVLHKVEASIKSKGRKNYITGTVILLAKKKKANTIIYDVQWKYNALGETPIKLAVFIPAFELASKLNCHLKNNNTQQRKNRTASLRSE